MRNLWLIMLVPGLAAGAAPTEPTVPTPEQRKRDEARVPLATAVVDAYPNWDGFFSSLVANFSPDAKQVLFGSVRDGLPEIYLGEVDKPAAAPRAITRGPERAIWARFTVDGKAILFLRDEKGNEQHHIWRVQADGSGARDLTPGDTLHRGEPVLPRKAPDLMIYGAKRTTSPQSFIYRQSIEKGAPRVVYTHAGPGGVAGATSDGGRALFLDFRSASENILLEVDVATGKPRRVYPPEGKRVAIFSADYSPDDALIYVGTDEGAESSVLLALDAKTGRETARYTSASPPTGALSALPSPRGDRVAIRIDAGHHGEVRLLDAHTLALERAVEVPLGDIQLGAFSDDGKLFSLLISLPDHPADIYAVDVASGKVRPLRDDKRPGLDGLPPLAASIENVKAFDGLTIPVNCYLPKHDPGRKLATIVIFHGGPSTSYAVRWSLYARFFAALGYAVLEPNVRGSTGFGRAYEMADNREKRADWLKDVEAVNAWVKAQPWADPERVVVWGQSYGGYTTLMALTRQPTLWRAGVDLYGPPDLKRLLLTTDAAIRKVFVLEFGDVEKDATLLERFSPMADVDKIVRPLFVYAGQNDPRVPRAESDLIVTALRRRNVPVEYMVAPNEGHTVDRRETKIELMTRAARFLEDALQP